MNKQLSEEQTSHEVKSPEVRSFKNLAKNKNIYEKYSILKKSPAINKVNLYENSLVISFFFK